MSLWRDRRFELAGEEISTAGIVDAASAARDLFGRDGGVTFGGGEPTTQMDALLDALAALKAIGVDTAVETNATTEGFERLFPVVDHLICDIKATDDEIHRRATGLSNARVLINLKSAATGARDLLVRVPLVVGVNDGKESAAIAEFLGELGRMRRERLGVTLSAQILRMHHIGRPKFAALGLDYPMEGVKEPAVSELEAFTGLLRTEGVEVIA